MIRNTLRHVHSVNQVAVIPCYTDLRSTQDRSGSAACGEVHISVRVCINGSKSSVMPQWLLAMLCTCLKVESS